MRHCAYLLVAVVLCQFACPIWAEGGSAGSAAWPTIKDIWSIQSQMSKSPQICASQARTLLDTGRTTPALHTEMLSTIIDLSALASTPDTISSERYMAMWDGAPPERQRALASFAGAFVRNTCPDTTGILILDSVEAALSQATHPLLREGEWSERVAEFFIRARVRCYIEMERPSDAVEAARGYLNLRVLSPTMDLRTGGKELLRLGSPEDLTALSDILIQMASKIERRYGEKPDAWVTGASLRARAQRAMQLGEIKRSARPDL